MDQKEKEKWESGIKALHALNRLCDLARQDQINKFWDGVFGCFFGSGFLLLVGFIIFKIVSHFL